MEGKPCREEKEEDGDRECINVHHSSDEEERVEEANTNTEKQFLEDMLKPNRVDVNQPEIREIQECVRQVLLKVVGSDLGVSDVILCGSMAEGTRVWEYDWMGNVKVPVIEFDFLALLETPVTMNKDAQEGEVRIRNGSFSGCKRVVADDNSSILQTSFLCNFLVEFRQKMLKYLGTPENIGPSKLSFRKKNTHQGFPGIDYQFTWKPFGLNPTPTFKPSQTELTKQPKCLIKVDFMPTFKYQDEATPCLFVPKKDRSWKLYLLHSYCREEIQSLKDTSQVHRDVFMLLKSFNNHIVLENKQPSYRLKTVVLRHIETCQKPDLVDCYLDIARSLRKSYSEMKLLTIKHHINLFETDLFCFGCALQILNISEKLLDAMSEDTEYDFKQCIDKLKEMHVSMSSDKFLRISLQHLPTCFLFC